ncbi:uncharacterized protein B0I36DRAFT_311337 [Microdochium trichocladiopsis]|uniref:DUF1763-domain-containing protein n=1 Tax=Microdochium trichocladiopsis TaxID=1682393 RepID=A0A9P9BWL7_9PEZI|nr:uncharacterized protein B0I36DRAFT_311337 [Microdochium trichocladiopsis]KAH7040725.1 hypothetical protein B0I36DRAFT_311337 [Microdochium trichocladiopsis]
MSTEQVLHAYRHLYRGLLHAVQFSKPARYVARDRLRVAFREEGAVLEPRSIARTLRFLEAATRERGLEHKVLKNLLATQFFRAQQEHLTWKHVKLNQSLKHTKWASPLEGRQEGANENLANNIAGTILQTIYTVPHFVTTT